METPSWLIVSLGIFFLLMLVGVFVCEWDMMHNRDEYDTEDELK